MELEVVAGLIAVALVVAGALQVLSLRERAPRGPRRRLVVATATTLDGVTAHVRATYLMTVTDTAVAEHDVDAVCESELEWGLRSLIATCNVAQLPTNGEAIEVVVGAPVLGVRIEHLTVESADVVVSPELRRLVLRGP